MFLIWHWGWRKKMFIFWREMDAGWFSSLEQCNAHGISHNSFAATLTGGHLTGSTSAGWTLRYCHFHPTRRELCTLPGLLISFQPTEADGTCWSALLSKSTEELLQVLSQKRVRRVALSTNLLVFSQPSLFQQCDLLAAQRPETSVLCTASIVPLYYTINGLWKKSYSSERCLPS